MTGFGALRSSVRSLTSRTPLPRTCGALDRFFDSLPAASSRSTFERFLETFFPPRGVSNSFLGLPRRLRVVAHDLDSAERVLFGAPGFDDVPVARACCAATALPLFYSPVRIRDGTTSTAAWRVGHLDVAESEGADLVVLVNPMVPVRADTSGVPTGKGRRQRTRQGAHVGLQPAMRIGVHAAPPRLDTVKDERSAFWRLDADALLLIEPRPTDAVLFIHNPASFAARAPSSIRLQTTRERVAQWIDNNRLIIDRADLGRSLARAESELAGAVARYLSSSPLILRWAALRPLLSPCRSLARTRASSAC